MATETDKIHPNPIFQQLTYWLTQADAAGQLADALEHTIFHGSRLVQLAGERRGAAEEAARNAQREKAEADDDGGTGEPARAGGTD